MTPETLHEAIGCSAERAEAWAEALTQASSGQDPEAQQRWRSLHERRKELMAAAAAAMVQ